MAQAAKLAANKITPAYFIFIKNKIIVFNFLYKKINLTGLCRLFQRHIKSNIFVGAAAMKAMLIYFSSASIKIATSGILRKYSPFY